MVALSWEKKARLGKDNKATDVDITFTPSFRDSIHTEFISRQWKRGIWTYSPHDAKMFGE